MKIKKLFAATLAAALMAPSAFANPDDYPSFDQDHPKSQDIMVTAEILPACYLDSAGDVDFGEIMPGWEASSAAHMTNSSVDVRCTKGTDFTVKFNQGENFGAYTTLSGQNTTGSRYMIHSDGAMDGMGALPYWLLNSNNDSDELGDGVNYGQPAPGTGTGLTADNTITIPVLGKIYEAHLSNIVPGSYKDTVTVTLCF